jgi:hypothetical protein
MKGEGMTAADYHMREPGDEWETFERWENEGGRLRQNDEAHYVAGKTLVAGGRQTLPESISAV